MGTITKIFKPRRGLKSTMTGSKASTVLSSGEMFVECQGSTVGKGKVKVKIGDGSTAYSSLDYALGDTSTDPISFSNNSSSTASAALNSVASGNSLQTIVGGLKQAASLNASSISKLNDENLSNTNSINSINTTLKSLTENSGGTPYAYIKVLVNGDYETAAYAYIGDKCYGCSNIGNNGIAIIPVSKKGTYTVKCYRELQDGTYSSEFIRTNTVSITNSNSIVTVTIDNAYGKNGKYGDLSFANTTDTQFANIVSALDAGKFTINELQWKVGDTRTVHLSAMPATYVGEKQAEQDVQFVIMNIGGVILTNGNECKYVVGMKNCLTNVGIMSKGISKVSWAYSSRRDWCNDTFKNAIPETIRGCFKQFKCISGEYNSSSIHTTDDYFALPAEKEIYSDSFHSTDAEVKAITTQFEWYKNGNFGKYVYNNKYVWWTRSVFKGDSNYFCTASGKSSQTEPYGNCCGISPFGCI